MGTNLTEYDLFCYVMLFCHQIQFNVFICNILFIIFPYRPEYVTGCLFLAHICFVCVYLSHMYMETMFNACNHVRESGLLLFICFLFLIVRKMYGALLAYNLLLLYFARLHLYINTQIHTRQSQFK